jgi:hypothetical protein
MSSSPRKRSRSISPSDNGNLPIDPFETASPLVTSFNPTQITPLPAAILFPSSPPLQVFDSPTPQQENRRFQTSPDSKPVKVESYPRLYISDSKIGGKMERLQHAKEYAHSLDKTTSLDPANSTVERHALTTIDSSRIRLSPHQQQTVLERIVGGGQNHISRSSKFHRRTSCPHYHRFLPRIRLSPHQQQTVLERIVGGGRAGRIARRSHADLSRMPLWHRRICPLVRP